MEGRNQALYPFKTRSSQYRAAIPGVGDPATISVVLVCPVPMAADVPGIDVP